MKKGISGHALTIIITLVVGMIGLVIFWLFIKHTTEGGMDFAREIACGLCKKISKGVLSSIPCPC